MALSKGRAETARPKLRLPTQREVEAVYLTNDCVWPGWPRCPLRRNAEHGLAFPMGSGAFVVFLVEAQNQITVDTKHVFYKTPYDLLDDGWRVASSST
jgi:hypothetical protein